MWQKPLDMRLYHAFGEDIGAFGEINGVKNHT
jgi:hypothetical protein